MAGKGGGSWKVAYADFVTAMMAFFLVMWIGAQDVKVRQSVANYFIDPSGVDKRPASAGAVLNTPQAGPVPEQAAVNHGVGTKAPGGPEPSPATGAVISWVRADTARFRHWRAQAQKCRDDAKALAEATNQNLTPEKLATRQLGQLLSSEVDGGIPKELPEVYQRLLIGSFKEVNWEQVADDIMRSS